MRAGALAVGSALAPVWGSATPAMGDYLHAKPLGLVPRDFVG
jgi:hypothetical protein